MTTPRQLPPTPVDVMPVDHPATAEPGQAAPSASRLPQTDSLVGGQAPSVVARPALYERLAGGVAAGVALLSSPAGSGKTVLLRSWIEAAGLGERAAWVSIERNERDGQRFWRAVVERLRAAAGPDALVETFAPTLQFNGDKLVERLITELGTLEEPVVLIIDDLHELKSPETHTQLARLLAQRPPLLRVVLATRHDPQLGLHRLRLAGQLTELREADLRFPLDETRELLATAGVTLSAEGLRRLHERTEGWAAGLRLAALSLTGNPNPERFVAEFSGSERTVADYLLAEVLARQPEDVRRLLLRTSILERVNGALADTLTDGSGSERVLHELEQENAFVVSLDADHSWFRYHHLFADLLRLELRRTAPEIIGELHRAAAAWYAAHGYVIEAVRHAQAAEDWRHATRLLADHVFNLLLNGDGATVYALLTAFPQRAQPDPELDLVLACYQLVRGSLDDAAVYITLAEQQAGEVAAERQRRFETLLAVARLSFAVRSGHFDSVFDDAQSLLTQSAGTTLGDIVAEHDARALALLNLGIAEAWSWRLDDATRHLEQALPLARRLDRPFVEVASLAHLTLTGGRSSFARERQRGLEGLAVAEEHGWGSEPVVCVALTTLGAAEVWQGRFAEACPWLDRAERALPPDLEPATELLLCLTRGMQYAGEGKLETALAAFRAALQCQARLVARHALAVQARQLLVGTLLRLGQTAAARAALAELPAAEREWGEARSAAAALHLAKGGGDARTALAILAPVLAGDAPMLGEFTMIGALILEAAARDRLGDRQAAEAALERALSLAQPDATILPFMLAPVPDLPDLLERLGHGTTHSALLTDILDVLTGASLPARASEPVELSEDLSESELRVLRYLQSHLSASEIAAELSLSTSTVKTHMRHIYAKLQVHRRTGAVERARLLGLLGPSARQRH